MRISPELTPISAIEVQSILGISSQCYNFSVESGILKKSNHHHRNSSRTAQHSFLDLLRLMMLHKLDHWRWMLDQADLDSIVADLLAQVDGTLGTSVRGSISSHQLTAASTTDGFEIAYEVRKILCEIEALWDSLASRVVEEV